MGTLAVGLPPCIWAFLSSLGNNEFFSVLFSVWWRPPLSCVKPGGVEGR
jgi:hypothetical protein